MEQFAFVVYALDGKRIANWVRLLQRIRDSELTNRIRYRVGFDSPLSGEQLDPGVIYAIITNEYLWSFNREGQCDRTDYLIELVGSSISVTNYKPD